MTAQLSIRGLFKTYPNGTQALKGISLDVPAGMFGLLGRNGAARGHAAVTAFPLTDLFETITLWDVKTRRAVVRRMPDEKYEVTLDVMAQKVRADSIGVETPTPMNDLIEVGVFASGKEGAICLARHRIRSGKQTIRIIVAREPSRAGVDPYRKLIERERGDNVLAVETARAETTLIQIGPLGRSQPCDSATST